MHDWIVHGGKINGFLALICRTPEEDIFITLNNTRVTNHAENYTRETGEHLEKSRLSMI